MTDNYQNQGGQGSQRRDPRKFLNRGGLWPNSDRKSSNSPDIRGSAIIACPHCRKITDMWVSLWHAGTHQGNQPHHTLSFQANENQSRADKLAAEISGQGQAGQQGGQSGGFGNAQSGGVGNQQSGGVFGPNNSQSFDDDIPF